MSAAIASQLECFPDTAIMAWDTLEMPWREKIQAAIALRALPEAIALYTVTKAIALWISAAREKPCWVS